MTPKIIISDKDFKKILETKEYFRGNLLNYITKRNFEIIELYLDIFIEAIDLILIEYKINPKTNAYLDRIVKCPT